MGEIGVDPRGIEIMVDKFQHFTLRFFNLSFRQAAIIKQEMLAKGGEAAISWKVCGWDQTGFGDFFGLLLSGTLRQLNELIQKLKLQPFGLPVIAGTIERTLKNYTADFNPLMIKGEPYDLQSQTYIMGIINITPDSFSKDGLYFQENYIDQAVRRAQQMIADGAHFIDVGAESTRPGAPRVDEEEEEKRLLPALKELVKVVNVPVSVDTYKPKVAEKALNFGASIINDIWGLQSPTDPEHRMAKLAADAKVPVIIMHNRKEKTNYQFIMKEIVEELGESITIGVNSGLELGQIIIDPGVGFAKTCQDNLQVLRNLDQLKILGRPILLGTSRKSVIGLTLDLPVEERLEGTIATVVWGISQGARIVRVHDVKEISRAVRMYDAISKG